MANKKDTRQPLNKEQTARLALEFARQLATLRTYDPKNPSSQKNIVYSQYKKEDIITWLQHPAINETSLRNASQYMFIASMHYRRLLMYYAGLYTGAYIVAPLSMDTTSVGKNFEKQFKKVTKALDLMDIPSVLYNCILVALRDGAFYGVRISDNNSCIIQQLDADYCKITSICDGSFLYSVDMTKISRLLPYYPPVFTSMYANYQATGERWQEVPVDVSVCIKADASLPGVTLPLFAAVMPNLYTLANIEALQESATEIKNYKMLSGQIQTDSKGAPMMDFETVQKYYNQVANALGDRVGLAITPFEFTLHSFGDKGSVNDVDDISNATSNFWSSAGTSGLLHGQENDTSGVTKLAIKNDETLIFSLVRQFERVINRYLKLGFSGSIKFKIKILDVTVFNREEKAQLYKEAATFGIGKSFYAASIGISQSDLMGLTYIENEGLIPFDKLQPLRSTYTETSDDKKAGRPTLSDGEIDAEGEATRDSGSNDNR